MNYQQAEQYIFEQLPMFQRIGPAAYKKDLTNTLLLLEALGNPHLEVKTIHIAGTNGKGSTSHIITNILQHAGFKVGLYTSPHYKDYRERVKVNANFIEKKYVAKFISNNQTLIEKIKPSFFEINTALAFCYFKDKKVDFAIIEVGLGGTYDSTNVIHPLLSVITNISYDHQNILGNTLPEIASNKAGIIKHKTPVVIGEYQEEINDVFIQKAKDEEAPIHQSDDLLEIIRVENELFHQKITFNLLENNQKVEIKTDLIGSYQTKNVKSALASILLLNKIYLNNKITFEHLKNGLLQVKKEAKLFGRFQFLQEKPITLLDSAHNIAGLKILFESVNQFSYKQLHIIFGTVNDKNLDTLFPILPKNAKYYLAKANVPRGFDAKELNTIFSENNFESKAYTSVKKAFSSAKLSAKEDDFILVCGSIFLVAEVL